MVRNQVKGAVNTRKKMKTYSKYFMWIWTLLIPITVAIILIFVLALKVKIEITEIWKVINEHGYKIERSR